MKATTIAPFLLTETDRLLAFAAVTLAYVSIHRNSSIQ